MTHFSTSGLQKVRQNAGDLRILTYTCASRHNGVHFFSTSELQKVVRRRHFFFKHFDLGMRFSPQRRAIFRHRNFKNCSDALNFFDILIWKCASRHSSVQFFPKAAAKGSFKKSAVIKHCYQTLPKVLLK